MLGKILVPDCHHTYASDYHYLKFVILDALNRRTVVEHPLLPSSLHQQIATSIIKLANLGSPLFSFKPLEAHSKRGSTCEESDHYAHYQQTEECL